MLRMYAIFSRPRPMVRRGDYYGPEPRARSTDKPEIDPGVDPHSRHVVFVN